MVGSSLNDVLQVSTVPSKSELKKKEEEETKEAKESSESQKTKQHKRVLEKGKPDDAMPGHKGRQVNKLKTRRKIGGATPRFITRLQITICLVVVVTYTYKKTSS